MISGWWWPWYVLLARTNPCDQRYALHRCFTNTETDHNASRRCNGYCRGLEWSGETSVLSRAQPEKDVQCGRMGGLDPNVHHLVCDESVHMSLLAANRRLERHSDSHVLHDRLPCAFHYRMRGDIPRYLQAVESILGRWGGWRVPFRRADQKRRDCTRR